MFHEELGRKDSSNARFFWNYEEGKYILLKVEYSGNDIEYCEFSVPEDYPYYGQHWNSESLEADTYFYKMLISGEFAKYWDKTFNLDYKIKKYVSNKINEFVSNPNHIHNEYKSRAELFEEFEDFVLNGNYLDRFFLFKDAQEKTHPKIYNILKEFAQDEVLNKYKYRVLNDRVEIYITNTLIIMFTIKQNQYLVYDYMKYVASNFTCEPLFVCSEDKLRLLISKMVKEYEII